MSWCCHIAHPRKFPIGPNLRTNEIWPRMWNVASLLEIAILDRSVSWYSLPLRLWYTLETQRYFYEHPWKKDRKLIPLHVTSHQIVPLRLLLQRLLARTLFEASIFSDYKEKISFRCHNKIKYVKWKEKKKCNKIHFSTRSAKIKWGRT